MRLLRRTVLALPLLLLAAAPAVAQEPTLYRRLGGYDALAAVADDFLGRLASDPTLQPFFVGHSANSVQRIRQLLVDQLCNATGGPCVYIGRDMKVTHAGLGITKAQWATFIHHLEATLDKFKVGAREHTELLGALGAMEKDVVEKP
jgi:hemoglobin